MIKILFKPNVQILIGAILGISMGIALNVAGKGNVFFPGVLFIADLVGGIFIKLLKMVAIPLIFTSIALGISKLQAHSQMGKVWRYTLLYFFCTSIIAVSIGLCAVNFFKPGVGLEIAILKEKAVILPQELSIMQYIKSMVAHILINPIAAIAQSKILPTVGAAAFLGIALIMAKDKGKRIVLLLEDFNHVIMILVKWIMKLAPIGIMSLLTNLLASQDLSIFPQIIKFIVLVFFATLFHGVVVLPLLLKLTTGIGPTRYFRGVHRALFVALSTSSSSATLPISMQVTEKYFNVNKNVSDFVLPLGATFNMDGSALYEAIAAIFIANIIGIELSVMQQIIIFIMAIISSIGAPGIPSAGMVTMIMVLQSVGLPAEGIVILLPIDRFLDTFRTAVNVEGDIIGACIVDHYVSSHKHLNVKA